MLVTIVPRIVTTKSLTILLFSFVMVSIIVSSVSVVYGESYLEQVKSNYDNRDTWSLGNNLQEGDYYSYKICNDDTMYQVIYPYHCYEISLEFVKILESYKGDTWIVQSYLTIGDTIGDTIGNNNTSPLVLLVDPISFDVTTDSFNRAIGESLENTIFSLSQYGVQSLSIGTVWDNMDSYFTNKIPLEIKNKQTIQVPHINIITSINGTVNTSIVTNLETSVLSYDIVIPSNTYLHESFPFPLKAVTYSPHIIYPEPQELYYFELIDHKSNNAIETIVERLEELGAEK